MQLLNTVAIINPEILLMVGALVLILFGGSKIPQLMRGLGKGMGEFHAGVAEGRKTMEESMRSPLPTDEKKDGEL